MAKSMRCKRVKRLRAIRRDIVEKESFTLTREDAKSAAVEAALAAPKLPVRQPPASPFMEVATPAAESVCATPSATADEDTDVEMDDGKKNKSLKPIGRKLKKKMKMGMKNRRSKGVLRGKRN